MFFLFFLVTFYRLDRPGLWSEVEYLSYPEIELERVDVTLSGGLLSNFKRMITSD